MRNHRSESLRRTTWVSRFVQLGCLLVIFAATSVADDEPPALNPFGTKQRTREDAIPGYVELSDGTVRAGKICLTRESRLQVQDVQAGRQRDVPLNVIKRIQCRVDKEWLEMEWRFKENANDEKVYTGRSYPARQYTHTLTLQDGRQDKGPLGAELAALLFVKQVELGQEALRAGLQRQAEREQRASKK